MRPNYDDMNTSFPSNRKSRGGKKVGKITAICVLLVLAVIILFFILIPSESKEGERIVENAPQIAIEESANALGEGAKREPIFIVESNRVEEISPSGEVASQVLEEATEEVAKESNEDSFFTQYTIRQGDTLPLIAKQYALSLDTLLSVNEGTQFEEGSTILIPPFDGFMHTYIKGESLELFLIEELSSLTVDQLLELNRVDELAPGVRLFIPRGGDFEIKAPLVDDCLDSTIATFGEEWDGKILLGKLQKRNAGSAVKAMGSGKVVDIGKNSEGFKTIRVASDNGFVATYTGFETVDVKRNDQVDRATVLGSAGRDNIYITLEKDGIPVRF